MRKRSFSIPLDAVGTGTQAIVVDPNAGVGDDAAVLDYSVYSGVDQTTPVSDFSDDQGADASGPPYDSLSSIANGTGKTAWVSHSIRGSGATGGTATGFTERSDNVNVVASGTIASVQGDAAGAAPLATSVAWAGVFAILYISHGFNLNDAATGPNPTSVAPSAGTVDGGTAVTITGTGFDASGGSSEGVTFGGVAATSVVFVNATTITCVTPAHAAGAVSVVVTNGDGTNGTLASGYTYQVGPVITNPMGPTDSNGVVPTGELTSDIALAATPGAFLRVNLANDRGTLRGSALPS